MDYCSKSIRMWHMEHILDILMACVSFHNMVIENEQDANLECIYLGIYAPNPTV